MSGGMDNRRVSRIPVEDRLPSLSRQVQPDPRPGMRHCQVSGPSGPRPGLILQWRQDPTTRAWAGWTIYVVHGDDELGDDVVIQEWVNAEDLMPYAASAEPG